MQEYEISFRYNNLLQNNDLKLVANFLRSKWADTSTRNKTIKRQKFIIRIIRSDLLLFSFMIYHLLGAKKVPGPILTHTFY